MTLRGEFDPTGFDIDDPDTYPQTDQRDEITDDLLYDDGDRWTVTGNGPFQGLDLTADGRLFARLSLVYAIGFGGAPLELDGAPIVLTSDVALTWTAAVDTAIPSRSSHAHTATEPVITLPVAPADSVHAHAATEPTVT